MRKFAAVIATATLTFSLVGISSPADAARKHRQRAPISNVDATGVCRDATGVVPCPVHNQDATGVCRDATGIVPCR